MVYFGISIRRSASPTLAWHDRRDVASRPHALSSQAKVGDADLLIEIPKYTINYEREGGAKK